MISYQPACRRMTLAWFLALVASVPLLLQGCEQLGPRPAVDSPADAILEAKATAKSYALLVSDLLTRQIITPAQAREQLEELRKVQKILELTARDFDHGDGFATEDRLYQVERVLSLVLAFLTEHQEEG